MSSLEMSSSDSSQQSTSSKLAENSAFREAENEVISIVTKVSLLNNNFRAKMKNINFESDQIITSHTNHGN